MTVSEMDLAVMAAYVVGIFFGWKSNEYHQNLKKGKTLPVNPVIAHATAKRGQKCKSAGLKIKKTVKKTIAALTARCSNKYKKPSFPIISQSLMMSDGLRLKNLSPPEYHGGDKNAR